LNIVAVSTAVNPGRPNFPPSQWFDDNAYGIDGFPFITLLDGDDKVTAHGRVSPRPTRSSS
jgi:hypothetical protein